MATDLSAGAEVPGLAGQDRSTTDLTSLSAGIAVIDRAALRAGAGRVA